ncbi:hypothetical protein BDR04DRAFT_1140078 [Suillus decipiens]|nr:hypothetical protein BDR04DRAFT_1140078 [Suillus decipiens]
MRLYRGSQTGLALLLLMHAAITVVAAVNFTQCLNNIIQDADATHNLTGFLDGDGDPVSNVSDAISISYSMWKSRCGTGQEPFQWSVFSQEFSAWLLPNTALISQLPFGAQYRLDNFMSAVLTVGSPTLAGYSLFIALLNSRWIKHRFDSVDHYNSRFALCILSSLQQVPLRLHPDHARLRSLILLPENDPWWKFLAEFVDYTRTWSIASASSIAWVIVAYILTIANSLSNVYADIQSSGEATGSMWLWLIPIVVGWLQLSPKCDFKRLQAAYDRADRHSLRIETADIAVQMLPASSRRALAITAKEDDVMSPDELLTPPVFNYWRSLRWASTVDTILMVFKVASDARSHPPVHGSERVRSGINIDDRNQHGSLQCAQPNEVQIISSYWAPGMFTRMVIASCASLALQWGTVAAFLVGWFTPTTGLGRRTISYLLYGVISTLVWMMLLMSSILAHSSAANPHRVSARVASGFSCYCNSSVLSRRGAAYAVIIETTAQAAQDKAAWIGAFVLACTSA